MTPTQTIRKSVILISLIYFLPIISALLMVNQTPFRETPALAYLLFIVALLLLLPAVGAVRYVEYALPKTRLLLAAAAVSAISALIILFTCLSVSFDPAGTVSILAFLLFLLSPFIILFFIPAWFTIPRAGEPYHIPQILATLPLVLGLLAIYFNFQIPGCMVGEISPSPASVLMPLFFGTAVIVSIIIGIILLYRGFTYPEEQ